MNALIICQSELLRKSQILILCLVKSCPSLNISSVVEIFAIICTYECELLFKFYKL